MVGYELSSCSRAIAWWGTRVLGLVDKTYVIHLFCGTDYSSHTAGHGWPSGSQLTVMLVPIGPSFAMNMPHF